MVPQNLGKQLYKERSLFRINTNLFFQIKPTEVATNSFANLYEEFKKANFIAI